MAGPQHEVKEGSVNFHHYISLRHFGDYSTVSLTWSRLLLFAFNNGFTGKDVTTFGLCYDDPSVTPADQIRYDACLAVPQKHFVRIQQMLRAGDRKDANRPELEGLRMEELGGLRKTLTVTHRGPYSENREAYTALTGGAAAARDRERQMDLPSVEIYRNNPLLTRPEDLVTEIHVQATR